MSRSQKRASASARDHRRDRRILSCCQESTMEKIIERKKNIQKKIIFIDQKNNTKQCLFILSPICPMAISKKAFATLRKKQAMLLEFPFNRKKTTAEDVMISPILLHLEDTIETILTKLQSEEINYCVVVDEDNHFIGEISDDMLLKIIAHASIQEPLVKTLDIGYKRGINYTRTKDYVKKHTYIITKDTPLYEIMKLIDTKWLQFIPVVDQTKKVVWLITPSSILKFVLRK